MNSEQLRRLGALVDEALALDAAQREAWLQALPPADQALAERLRAALGQLSQPAQAQRFEALPPLGEPPWLGRAGERIGPYALVEALGRGGMGEVWRARRADGAFEREVALKIPRRWLGHDLAARLQFECQVAARLEHRHIARLYDAGLDAQGRPWVASELVPGLALDEAAAPLPLRERLRLLVWVARAVAYAHGRGVLHRDLKPANVRVDAEGVPRLLDFGVAALTDAPSASADGEALPRALTPRYAAPEQRAGAGEDVRVDVFALGVMAAELCAAQAGADLGAVLAKAQAADPEQRYAGAADFADELERVLQGEPVRARRPGWAERRLRWLRRHWLRAAALGSVLLALLLGGGVSLLHMQRSAQALAQEREARHFIADLLRIGQQQMGRSEALLDRGPELVAARFADRPALQWELLGQLDRSSRDMGDGAQLLRLRERRVALLPQLRLQAHERVEARLALIESQLRRGLLREAQAGLDGLSEANPQQAQRATLLRARLRSQQGEPAAAAGLLAVLDRQWPADGPLRIEWLAVQAELDYRGGRPGQAMDRLEQAAGLADAEPDVLRAADLRSSAAYWAAESGQRARALALQAAAEQGLRSQGGLQLVRLALGQAEFWEMLRPATAAQAREQLDKVREAWRQIEWLGDAVPPRIRATVQRRLAGVLLGQGLNAEGRPLLQQALQVLASDEQRPLHRAYLLAELAQLAEAEGRRAEAERLALQGLQERQRAGFGLHPYVVNVYMGLALNALAMGDPARALAHLDSAPSDAALQAAGHRPAWFRSVIHKTRAHVLLASGRPAEALQVLQGVAPAATDFQVDVIGIGLPWLRASALCRLGRRAEGRAELDAALQRMPAGGPRDHALVLEVRRLCRPAGPRHSG